MTAYTPSDAAKVLCPQARLFGGDLTATCRAADCMAWRWQELSSAILIPHVQRRVESEKAEGRNGSTKDATAWVMENRESLGIPTKPTHGYCGMGGKP